MAQPKKVVLAYSGGLDTSVIAKWLSVERGLEGVGELDLDGLAVEDLADDGGQVEIVAHLVHELDPNGRQLRVVRYTDYAAESVRSLAPTSADLRSRWSNATQRAEIIAALAERGIDFALLAEQTGQLEADPFDLLCHLAFNAPLRTRRERAQRLKSERKDYFEKFSPEARQILDELLEKYAEHGDAQFVLPDVLKVPPISTHGQPAEIIKLFGGAEQLRQAVNDLQGLLYGQS